MSATDAAAVLAGVAALAGLYRLLAGPSTADRVVALDLLFALGIVLCICAALASASTTFLDVAIGLALVGFVGTIAWARAIELARRSHGDEEP